MKNTLISLLLITSSTLSMQLSKEDLANLTDEQRAVLATVIRAKASKDPVAVEKEEKASLSKSASAASPRQVRASDSAPRSPFASFGRNRGRAVTEEIPATEEKKSPRSSPRVSPRVSSQDDFTRELEFQSRPLSERSCNELLLSAGNSADKLISLLTWVQTKSKFVNAQILQILLNGVIKQADPSNGQDEKKSSVVSKLRFVGKQQAKDKKHEELFKELLNVIVLYSQKLTEHAKNTFACEKAPAEVTILLKETLQGLQPGIEYLLCNVLRDALIDHDKREALEAMLLAVLVNAHEGLLPKGATLTKLRTFVAKQRGFNRQDVFSGFVDKYGGKIECLMFQNLAVLARTIDAMDAGKKEQSSACQKMLSEWMLVFAHEQCIDKWTLLFLSGTEKELGNSLEYFKIDPAKQLTLKADGAQGDAGSLLSAASRDQQNTQATEDTEAQAARLLAQAYKAKSATAVTTPAKPIASADNPIKELEDDMVSVTFDTCVLTTVDVRHAAFPADRAEDDQTSSDTTEGNSLAVAAKRADSLKSSSANNSPKGAPRKPLPMPQASAAPVKTPSKAPEKAAPQPPVAAAGRGGWKAAVKRQASPSTSGIPTEKAQRVLGLDQRNSDVADEEK